MLRKYATLRAATASAILAALLLPGCGPDGLFAHGNSTSVTTHDNGAAKITIRRPGYALRMETDGLATFHPDESDVEALVKGGALELSEKIEGVRHLYTVRERDGGLVRSYMRDGAPAQFDAAAQGWLAEALQRMFRETSFDAEARCARLLERGGSELVLREVEQTKSESAKRSLLEGLASRAAADPVLEGSYRALAGSLSEPERRQALQALAGAAR